MEKYRIGDRVIFISDEPSLYACRYAEGHYKIEKVKYIGVIRNVHPIMKGMCLYTIETIPPLRWICLVKDGKWGLVHFYNYVEPIYDRMEIRSEEYVKVWLGDVQGWLDSHGKFTCDESKAFMGSWCDFEK